MLQHDPARMDQELLYDVLASLSAEGLWTFGALEPILDRLDAGDVR